MIFQSVTHAGMLGKRFPSYFDRSQSCDLLGTIPDAQPLSFGKLQREILDSWELHATLQTASSRSFFS